MKINMGSIDRLIRTVLAIIFGALYITGAISGTLGLILMIVAGVFLLTSAFGTCPLYSLFGISSCTAKGASKK